MEARTLNHLPPAASHDEAVRCLLAIELSKKSWIVAVNTPLSDKIGRHTLQARLHRIFGIGCRVVNEVSKDGTVYETANDRRRNPALATAPWLRTIPGDAAFVRPRVYAGDDATLITVTAVFQRPAPMSMKSSPSSF
jgi:hypothetical protein